MSRCFSFPPPGYVRNGFRDEALVELIKREEKKNRKEKKERKKEKKEKKEKKRKDRECRESEIKQPGLKRQRKADGTEEYTKEYQKADGTKEHQKVEDHHKRKVNETENLERSSLTEERQLVGSQNSCDSTLNSNKRRKRSPSPPCPPPDDSRQYNNSESIIRIRLPVKRLKDPQVLIGKEQQPCFSRGRVDAEDACQPAAYIPSRELAVREHPCSNSTDTAHEQHSVSFDKEKGNYTDGDPKQLTLKLRKEESSKEKLQSFSGSSKPSTSWKPEPLISRKPEPLISRKPEPLISRKPEPSTSRKPEPSTSRKPKPSTPRKPEPSTAKKPEPSTAKKPEPSTSRKPEASVSGKPEASVSGKPEASVSGKPEPSTEPSTLRKLEPSTSREPGPSTLRKHQPSTSRKPEVVQTPNLCGFRPPSVVLKFQELIENWVPSSVHEVSIDADDCWLLRSKKPIPAEDRRETSGASMNQEHPTSTWPKACYLPEADVYALPFTVPL